MHVLSRVGRIAVRDRYLEVHGTGDCGRGLFWRLFGISMGGRGLGRVLQIVVSDLLYGGFVVA